MSSSSQANPGEAAASPPVSAAAPHQHVGAVPEVAAMCTHRLSRAGGRGAVREFVEDFLKARGEWEPAWNRYVNARSHPRPSEIAS